MGKVKEIILRVNNGFNHSIESIKSLDKKDLINKIRDNKMVLGVVASIIICLIVVFSSSITSKTQLLEDLDVGLKNGVVAKINKHIEFQGEALNKKELEPLMLYYKENKSRVNETVEKLRKFDESEIFTIRKQKKLFWDDYYLELDPLSIKVKTNIKDTDIYLNDKLLDDKLKDSIIPGLYKVRAVLKTPYGNVEKEETVSLMDSQEIPLNLDATNITISSNINDADVYINGKSIGKKVNEIKDFGPIPVNSNVVVSLEKKFPWGTIKSDEVKVTDVPNMTININMVNDRLIKDIEKISQEFYESVFNALNSANPDLILFVDKSTKEKIYNDMEKKSFFLKNNYEIKELSTESEISEFEYKDNYYLAKVSVKVNYSIYKKLLPFMKEHYEQRFLTTMKYVDNQWKVEDIQRFELQ